MAGVLYTPENLRENTQKFTDLNLEQVKLVFMEHIFRYKIYTFIKSRWIDSGASIQPIKSIRNCRKIKYFVGEKLE